MTVLTDDEVTAVLHRADSEGQHDLRPDGPDTAGRVRQWTCRSCGNVVLRHAGSLFGAPLDAPCTFNRLDLDYGPPRPANCGCVPICQCPPDDETEEGSA